MSNTTISPNMNLPVPTPGVDPGPDWANNLSACLGPTGGGIDGHNHTSGNGVAIPPDGININTDLPFNVNNATLLRSVRFSPQSAPLALAADLGCLYESGVDLYFNDGVGNQVRITQNGAVAGSPGSISNLASPASASYVSGSATFVWQSAANVSANMDCGSIILRDLTVSSNGVTISAPTALSANYALALPAALPSSQKIVTIDNSGNIAAAYVPDNVTIDVSTNLIQVKDGGITPPKMGALGQQVSTSSNSYTTTSTSLVDVTNLEVTITSYGRPVYVGLISDSTSTSNNSFIGPSTSLAGADNIARYAITRDGSVIYFGSIEVVTGSATNATLLLPGSLFQIDVVAAGTYTYKVQTLAGANCTSNLSHCKLIAYEI